MSNPKFEGQLSDKVISPKVLEMIPKGLVEKRLVLPVDFTDGTLLVVTSRYMSNFADLAVLTKLITKHNSMALSIKLVEVSYEEFVMAYNVNYRQPFTPEIEDTEEKGEDELVTAQTKIADEILDRAIDAEASDIHITPILRGALVQYRINGQIVDTDINLSVADEMIIGNIYKRRANIEVNNLIPQDGRFTHGGKNIRLSTMPYGGEGRRNKIVMRVLSVSEVIPTLRDLDFGEVEEAQLHRIMYKSSGIVLVCGPTGEGKTTTLYSMLDELNQSGKYVIVTFEDPVERYIDGIAQSQVRDAENERNRYTFQKGLRSGLRQDPDIILVGEIRDAETALTAVQSSQTGHLIFSTLHVRNSISVFRRLNDMGVNVSGFVEQVAGIASQRLLALNCPYCRERVESPLNARLRKQDIALLEDGKYTYVSRGCSKCHNTGIAGRVPVIEIIEFNNKIRDYFSERHGLIEIETYLRNTTSFASLWDKGMARVAEGEVSLEELLSRIEPDEELGNL